MAGLLLTLGDWQGPAFLQPMSSAGRSRRSLCLRIPWGILKKVQLPSPMSDQLYQHF